MERKNSIEYRLYLGRNIGQDGRVEDKDLDHFIHYGAGNYLESFTILEGTGYWKGTREGTVVLVCIGDDSIRMDIKAVGELYRMRFGQEEVLMTETRIVTERICQARSIKETAREIMSETKGRA